MSYKTYMLLRVIGIIIIATLGVWAVATDNKWIMIPVVIAGTAILLLGRDGSPELFQVGLTLAYSVCAILVMYWIAYFYYSRKYGGRE